MMWLLWYTQFYIEDYNIMALLYMYLEEVAQDTVITISRITQLFSSFFLTSWRKNLPIFSPCTEDERSATPWTKRRKRSSEKRWKYWW